MDGRKTIKNIISVAFSNLATIIAGVIIGFIIPKVLPVEGYGYYKTFTLYINYIGLFSLGIIDGIVLDYGGKDYSEFDKSFFRSIFMWYLLVHAVWLCIFIFLSIIFDDRNYSFIIFMIGIYMLFANVVGFFQQISQITQRFKEYSKAKVIQSLMKTLGGLIMIGIYVMSKQLVDFKIYIVLTTIGFATVAVGYVVIYRQIVFGKADRLRSTKKNVLHFAKIGFPLLFANLCGTLILSLDRQFVNILFSNNEYAIYAFAYNMMSLVTVATSAVSTVLYPLLKRTSVENLKHKFNAHLSAFLVFASSTLVLFYPLCAFVTWFLPKYHNSLVIFRIIFPGIALSSSISVVMHNYYKAIGKNIIYFKNSLIILVLSAVANVLAYYLYRTTYSISIASIFTILIWYCVSEQFFVKEYGYHRWNNLFYAISIMTAFYVFTSFNNLYFSLLLYLIAFLLITFVFQKAFVLEIYQKITNKK